ncbi:unnamed protein product (macronuclear) [Paramecium tetraurelia]|uniref:Vacuolar protein 14 C-terminal Fig4-binding domain-containing protein n=1 Tax=Paramecium tetraurelia TaxID=5888 RepID=A0EIB5_PARTE|nr:uncharacterized protein GSPATT00027385001 [Paramecium tetraurelia]CAK95056.1 unnamed protein product [Paramecium tetraurelia]|eukprot:XP_001462429.1 hypothetical protein (macronuclear) [Paramecium tetraurelia strain d4-2]
MDDNVVPQQIIKLLQDKSQDKKQQGCQQLKSLVESYAQSGKELLIKQIIETLKIKLTSQSQLQYKRQGMVAIQTVAELLVKEFPQLAEKCVKDLTQPILECLNDKEDKARQYAVECLLQLTKIMKTMILLNFNEIFDYQLGRSAEQESSIVQAMFLLDQLLKSQVQTAVQEKFLDPGKQYYFNLNSFMNQLQNKLKTRVTYVRQFLLGWIKVLNQCHNNDLYIYFPMILEGIFMMLGESNKEVRNGADLQANEFLKQVEIKVNLDQRVNEQIIEILLKICQMKGNQNNYAKLNSLLWIFEYLRVFQQELEEEQKCRLGLQHSPSHVKSDEYLRSNTSPISKNQIQQYLGGFESPLRKTILNSLSQILGPILILLSHEEEEIRKAAQKTNELLLKVMDRIKNQSVEFINIVPTIKEMLTDKKSNTAESALIWMKHLLEMYSESLFPTIEDILTKLIDKLADSESAIVQNIMDVLANISMHSQYFEMVIDKILIMLHKNQEQSEKKGDQIFKKLCSLLNPQKVYFTITAKLLEIYSENDVIFISNTVQILTNLLISEKELQNLRNILRNLKHEKDDKKKQQNQEIFETLYRTFCYNSMSVITLCLLSEEYELAYKIIISFSEVEVNECILSEIAQLINVLETPVFIFLRLQLLEYDSHPFLMKCLFGLMMLLPQGVAFNTLRQRLKNVSNTQIQSLQQDKKIEIEEFLDIQRLLSLFRDIRFQCINQESKQKDQH